jgi:hypothetical protein
MVNLSGMQGEAQTVSPETRTLANPTSFAILFVASNNR